MGRHTWSSVGQCCSFVMLVYCFGDDGTKETHTKSPADAEVASEGVDSSNRITLFKSERSESVAPSFSSAARIVLANSSGVALVHLTVRRAFLKSRKRPVLLTRGLAPCRNKYRTTVGMARADATQRAVKVFGGCSLVAKLARAPRVSTNSWTHFSIVASRTCRARQHSTRKVPPVLVNRLMRRVAPYSSNN